MSDFNYSLLVDENNENLVCIGLTRTYVYTKAIQIYFLKNKHKNTLSGCKKINNKVYLIDELNYINKFQLISAMYYRTVNNKGDTNYQFVDFHSDIIDEWLDKGNIENYTKYIYAQKTKLTCDVIYHKSEVFYLSFIYFKWFLNSNLKHNFCYTSGDKLLKNYPNGKSITYGSPLKFKCVLDAIIDNRPLDNFHFQFLDYSLLGIVQQYTPMDMTVIIPYGDSNRVTVSGKLIEENFKKYGCVVQITQDFIETLNMKKAKYVLLNKEIRCRIWLSKSLEIIDYNFVEDN